MSIRKFEKKMLQQINQIDEGFALGILKMLFRPAVKRAFEDLKATDSEFAASMEGLEYHGEVFERRIKQLKKDLKSKDPDTVEHAKKMLKILGVK